MFVFYCFKFFSISETGPWKQVLDGTLDDSRQQNDPLPLQTFNFDPETARFAKFKLLSYWGSGGGLQYFKIKKSKKDLSLSLEQNEDFVSFKSNDDAYLTVDGEKNLGFTKSSAPEENQKFLLDEQCSSSKFFNTFTFSNYWNL